MSTTMFAQLAGFQTE